MDLITSFATTVVEMSENGPVLHVCTSLILQLHLTVSCLSVTERLKSGIFEKRLIK